MQGLTLITILLFTATIANALYQTNRVSRRLSFECRAGPFDFLSGIFKESEASVAAKSLKIENLKSSLFRVTKGTSNGIKATQAARDEVSEIVTELEKLNSVSVISSSPVMNGNWKLIYTTNDGSSAGRLGAFIGRVDQDIDVSANKYINYVRLGGIVQGALTASWDNLSPKLWRVKFLDLAITVFGIPVTKKSLVGSIGTWRMTYLDDNVRILYAQGGKNTVLENIYILAKDKF
jgi:PAP_fibrillin